MMAALDLSIRGNRDFLDAIFGTIRSDERIWTAQFKTDPHQASGAQWGGLVFSEHYQNQNPNHVGWNHFFCVSTLKTDASGGVSRTKAHFSRLFALVLDDASPIPGIEPTWIIETSLKVNGEPNVQVGYRLAEPIEDLSLAIHLHAAVKGIGHIAEADKNGNNPVRYVRLPWGWNTKCNPPHQHKLTYFAPLARVGLQQLADALGIDLSAARGDAAVIDTQCRTPIDDVIHVGDEAQWKPKARKLAWDGALRTHNDPKLGRNEEVFKLGTFAARDRLPVEALDFVLQEFVAQMRPTNTSGKLAPANLEHERATIRRGYETGHKDGVPKLVSISSIGLAAPTLAAATESDASDAPALSLYAPSSKQEFPSFLIDQAPGVIGTILDWGLRTAHKPQPHLALQSAIVAAMAPMARRYRTTLNNWPMLWFLGIAITASGKEHGKTIVENVLSAAGLESMIGGSGYTSPGAVFSSLMDRPAHVGVIDEFGKLMESAQAFGNQIKSDAITMMMEVFGRAHGIVRPTSYSLMSMTKEQRDALQSRKICNPSIMLLSMTTPGTFYPALSQRWIADGFLGRFLTCESPIGRMPSVYPQTEAVPDAVTDWMLETSRASVIGGVPVHLIMPSDVAPDPIVMDFTTGAMASIRAFENDINAKMDSVQRHGLEVLLGRTVEKAMRLSMVVAMSEDASARTITDTHFQWAMDYAMACDSIMVEKAMDNIADSDFARVKNRCIELIRMAGSRGLTARELGKKSSAFDAMRPREQVEVLEAIERSCDAAQMEIKTAANRGRKRVAWVATQPDES